MCLCVHRQWQPFPDEEHAVLVAVWSGGDRSHAEADHQTHASTHSSGALELSHRRWCSQPPQCRGLLHTQHAHTPQLSRYTNTHQPIYSSQLRNQTLNMNKKVLVWCYQVAAAWQTGVWCTCGACPVSPYWTCAAAKGSRGRRAKALSPSCQSMPSTAYQMTSSSRGYRKTCPPQGEVRLCEYMCDWEGTLSVCVCVCVCVCESDGFCRSVGRLSVSQRTGFHV